MPWKTKSCFCKHIATCDEEKECRKWAQQDFCEVDKNCIWDVKTHKPVQDLKTTKELMLDQFRKEDDIRKKLFIYLIVFLLSFFILRCLLKGCKDLYKSYKLNQLKSHEDIQFTNIEDI